MVYVHLNGMLSEKLVKIRPIDEGPDGPIVALEFEVPGVLDIADEGVIEVTLTREDVKRVLDAATQRPEG